jgi:hypothetical protein
MVWLQTGFANHYRSVNREGDRRFASLITESNIFAMHRLFSW